VGVFVYGSVPQGIEIDDRTLAHVRVVVMSKLRRAEPFMFDVTMNDGTGRRTFWVHPSVPVQFRFFGRAAQRINRRWVEELMSAASGPNGLAIVPEPAADVTPPP
jgi:hypothetical protein